MLKRVKFITIPVTDQDRALAFYTSKVGLKVFTDQTMGGTRWIELQIPSGETMIGLEHQPGHVPNGKPAVALIADNVPATYEELRSWGVEFTQSPRKEPWGTSAVFKDSEGNLIVFANG